MENPYKPTAAALRDPPKPPRSPLVAMIAGIAVDFGGTILSTLLIGIVYGLTLVGRGMAPDQLEQAFADVDPGSGYFIVSTVVGGAFSLLGGYVCARLVRRNERKVTAILALVNGGLGLLLSLASDDLNPLLDFGAILLTVAANMAGGELGRRRNLANAGDAPVTAE
jgi:uncharacterized membrane protein AbrB (regulator of aidB expression)